MNPSNKPVNFNYRLNLINNGIRIIQNDCFGNVERASSFDNSKKLIVGYIYDSSKNLCTLHSWLESSTNILEITINQNAGNVLYYKFIDLKSNEWRKLKNNKWISIDTLIGHRFFSLKFLRAQNYFSQKHSYFGVNGFPEQQGLAKYQNKKDLIGGYWGHFEFSLRHIISSFLFK